MREEGIGCVVAVALILLIVQAFVYYASWVLVTTFTDFDTVVSVILTFILGSILGSLMSGGARYVTH